MTEKPAETKEDKESPDTEQETQEEPTQEQPEKQEEKEPDHEPVLEQSEEKPEKKKQAKADKPKKIFRKDNVILVGKKPAMSYVMAVITQFSGGASEIDIKARGKSISRAVDVAEVARKRFLKDLKYRIEIGTDEITDDQGSKVNVSTININLSK